MLSNILSLSFSSKSHHWCLDVALVAPPAAASLFNQRLDVVWRLITALMRTNGWEKQQVMYLSVSLNYLVKTESRMNPYADIIRLIIQQAAGLTVCHKLWSFKCNKIEHFFESENAVINNFSDVAKLTLLWSIFIVSSYFISLCCWTIKNIYILL